MGISAGPHPFHVAHICELDMPSAARIPVGGCVGFVSARVRTAPAMLKPKIAIRRFVVIGEVPEVADCNFITGFVFDIAGGRAT